MSFKVISLIPFTYKPFNSGIFLNARADDGATFGWTPLDSSTSYKWRSFAWTKSLIYKNRVSLKATFVQYFEP